MDYLASIRPPNASGPIHFNPSTGQPYVDIRKQWNRLLEIAARMLGYDLEGKKDEFFNFRHTGASHIAQRGKTPAHLLAVVKMMGDTSVETVNKHYFNIELDLIQEMVLGWERPDVPVPSTASLPVFGAEQTPICDVPLGVCAVETGTEIRLLRKPHNHISTGSEGSSYPRKLPKTAFFVSTAQTPSPRQLGALEANALPKRRTPFPRRYTTVHMKRDGVRVPFVRLSGRWLEAFGFKEGAKFTAIGVEGGLLVLAVYEPAPAPFVAP